MVPALNFSDWRRFVHRDMTGFVSRGEDSIAAVVPNDSWAEWISQLDIAKTAPFTVIDGAEFPPSISAIGVAWDGAVASTSGSTGAVHVIRHRDAHNSILRS